MDTITPRPVPLPKPRHLKPVPRPEKVKRPHEATHRQLNLTMPNDLYKAFDLARAAEQTTIERVMTDPEQAKVAKTSTVGFMVMLMCMGFERFVEAVAEGDKAPHLVLTPAEAAQEQRART